jgi:hypothetical protein
MAHASPGKTLAEFEAVSQMEDAFRPATETLKDLGPEGVALGAAALGIAALGAMAEKKSLGSKGDLELISEFYVFFFDLFRRYNEKNN